jgi:transcriptional regulator with XRE-family HTH domain
MNSTPRKFNPARLKKARGKLSVEKVAGEVGVSRDTVRRWEAGTTEPTATALEAIARLTGRTLNFFYGLDRAS